MRNDGAGWAGVLTREQCEELAQRVFGLISPGARAQLTVSSGVEVTTQFARGDTHLSTEIGGVSVTISVDVNGRHGYATGSRIDDDGIRVLVAEAEGVANQWRRMPRGRAYLGSQHYKTPPKLYFDEVHELMTPAGRQAIVHMALDAADAAGLIGAGDVALSRSSSAKINTAGLFAYTARTFGEFSLTARTKDGTGSGGAWDGHVDWTRVDPRAVIAKAVGIAQRSVNPVAIEPGRYTVILEPPAVAALISDISWNARTADNGNGVFAKDPIGTNKIGLKMIDERLNMVSDPWDPEVPHPTFGDRGEPVDKTQWFQDGVLVNLRYDSGYARQKNREPVIGPENLRLYGRGRTQTLDEMVASTKRGVWVNRFSASTIMNGRTLLLTGVTRDGAFLIEDGKITKPIKNMRFMESPFFVFNRVESFGEPVGASPKLVAPRMKIRDFNFTSLTDAV